MFSDDDPPSEPSPFRGSAARYKARIQSFVNERPPRGGEPPLFPKARHHALWMLHNCVAHPLLAVGPTSSYALDFHELTSAWLNNLPAHRTFSKGEPVGRERWLHYASPKIRRRSFWLLHNLVAHTLIGIAPSELTFRFHDWSANEMDVPGWV